MNKTVKILMALVGVLAITNILILSILIFHRPPQPFGNPSMGEYYETRLNRLDPETRERFKNCRRELMGINQPLINKLRTFDQEIYNELLKEKPDTSQINLYIDSTHEISKQMRMATIKYFIENKDSLTTEQKKYLLQNILKKHVRKHERKFRNKMKGRR